MTARDLIRSIEPGSIPHGERQGLESGLSQVLPAAQQPEGGGGASGVPGGGSVAIPEDPLGALLTGEIAGDPNMPQTAGLSVGAGSGPAVENDVMMGSRAERVRALATESSSPLIRQAARNELRRMAREGI